jgi:hypothetical protein
LAVAIDAIDARQIVAASVAIDRWRYAKFMLISPSSTANRSVTPEVVPSFQFADESKPSRAVPRDQPG